MRSLSFLFLLLAVVVKSQSLEQFLSFPKESNLAASADGKLIAWVVNDKGVRNIFIKIGIDQPKMFTDFQKDDGEEISRIVFSANGTKLAFVKGKFIYYKGLTSQFSPLKITEGTNPVFYPDGLKLVFTKQGQLFETNLEINPEIKSLGVNEITSDLKLSPGNGILFASDRNIKSAVGIFSLETKGVRWIPNEKSSDYFPVWSADEKQIAFFKKQETTKAISLCVADATASAVKEIWNSAIAVDDFFAKGISKPIYWTSTNRILFYSEHTGWRHVYSIKPDGSGLRDVTPGENEVDNFTIDSFAQNIYYSTNKDDAERRHIWKSNLTIENVTQITKAPGIETDPMMVGPFLYCFKSTANTPSVLTRIDELRKTTTPINSQQAAPTYFVKPEAVIVPSSGESLYGQLFIDRMLNGKRKPLVFIHGRDEQMMTGFHNKDVYSDFYAFNQYLASIGYAVIAINYRGSTGHGHDFRATDANKENQDVLAAAKFLQLLPEVDKSKVGVFGLDFGGSLAEQALIINSTIFKAGVNIQSDNDKSTNQNNFDAAKYISPFLLIENETMNSSESKLKIFKSVQEFFDKKLK